VVRLALLLALAAVACQPIEVARSSGTPSASGSGVSGGAPGSTSGAAPPAQWRRIADIPTPRSEVAAAVYQQDKVYVIGGFGGADRVERYDAATGRWDRLADLPHGVDHAMSAAVFGIQTSGDEGVYVFGGYAGAATARSFRLDVTTGRWSEIAPMPSPRAAGAAVAINTRLYIVGGADGSRLISPTYVYDVTTRDWRTLAPIPTPRDHLAAVELNGRVCAVGGRRLSLAANLGSLECYLPETDRWEQLADAPTPRGGVGAAAWDGRIYLVGGEQSTGTFKEVEIYDERTGSWSRGPDLPTPRHGLGVAAVGGTSGVPRGSILVLAGGPTPGGSQTAVCEALDVR